MCLYQPTMVETMGKIMKNGTHICVLKGRNIFSNHMLQIWFMKFLFSFFNIDLILFVKHCYFFSYVYFGPSPFNFMDNLAKKLLTHGSYSPSYYRNFPLVGGMGSSSPFSHYIYFKKFLFKFSFNRVEKYVLY